MNKSENDIPTMWNEWQPLKGHNNYLINPMLGAIKHRKKDKIIFGNPISASGYRQVYIEGKTWYIYRLIWYHCHGEIAPKMTINHIDHNPSNNSIANLEIVTQSENLKKRRSFKWTKKSVKESDLDGYVPLRDFENYLINPKKGTVIHKRHQRILGSKMSTGYVAVTINKSGWLLHRLVWYHVNGPIPVHHEIDHIDGNKQNNCIDNLQCLSKAEHAKKTGQTAREKRASDDDIEEFNEEDDLDDLEDSNLEGVIQDLEDEGEFDLADGLRSHLE